MGQSIDDFISDLQKKKKQQEQKPDLTKEYLSPQQYANKMQIHKETVLKLLRSEKIQGFKIGRSWRIPVN